MNLEPLDVLAYYSNINYLHKNSSMMIQKATTKSMIKIQQRYEEIKKSNNMNELQNVECIVFESESESEQDNEIKIINNNMKLQKKQSAEFENL